MVIKSFKIKGISNKLDGSEDYLFDGYDVINNLTEKKNLIQIVIRDMIQIKKNIKKSLLAWMRII